MLEPRPTRRAFLAGVAALAASARVRAGDGTSRLPSAVAAELDEAVRWASGSGARLGACFIDVQSGLELGGVEAGVAENPASNEKLVTVGTLLRHWAAGAS